MSNPKRFRRVRKNRGVFLSRFALATLASRQLFADNLCPPLWVFGRRIYSKPLVFVLGHKRGFLPLCAPEQPLPKALRALTHGSHAPRGATSLPTPENRGAVAKNALRQPDFPTKKSQRLLEVHRKNGPGRKRI